MHKFLHRVRSNSKGSDSKRKAKKDAKAHVAAALAPAMIVQKLAHSEVPKEESEGQPKFEKCCSHTDSLNEDSNEGIYCMAADEDQTFLQEGDMEEDIYELTDLVIEEESKIAVENEANPRRNRSVSTDENDPQLNAEEESAYDHANSLTSDCVARAIPRRNRSVSTDENDPQLNAEEENAYDHADSLTSDCVARAIPRRNRSVSTIENDSQLNDDEENAYDHASSLTSDCVATAPPLTVRNSRGSESDTNSDDIYSHLAEEIDGSNDQEYDRLERNRSNINEVVYDSFDVSTVAANTEASTVNSTADCYEDVDIPIREISKATSKSITPSLQSEVPTDDNTYEDVSSTILTRELLIPLTKSDSSRTEGHVTPPENIDDTYEDVSSLPIQRFREKQPLPDVRDKQPLFGVREKQPLPGVRGKQSLPDVRGKQPPSDVLKLKPDFKGTDNDSRRQNEIPLRQILTTPDITPPTPRPNDRKLSIDGVSKNIFKTSRSKHSSQWFSKPFLKNKQKYDLKKRSPSKSNVASLSPDGETTASSPPELKNDANPLSSPHKPSSPGKRGQVSPPVILANSLEESPLYKSMQQKLANS